MAYTSLLCVTLCGATAAEVEPALLETVDSAAMANRGLGITGALLFTGEHLVEVIELRRPAEEPDAHFVSLNPDWEQVVFVEERKVSQRRFSEWSTASTGPSHFVSGHVSRLLEASSPDEKRRAAQRLTDLVYEFARTPGKA
jgi:hypothetical protein